MLQDCKQKGTEGFVFLVREKEQAITAKEAVPSRSKELQAVLQEYKDVLVDGLPPRLPPPRAVDHRIELLPGSDKPPHRPCYRMSPLELQESRRQVEEYLAKGYTRPSVSPYGGADFICPQEEQEVAHVHWKNSFLLPRIDELLEHLSGARYFSKLDLASGYHQIRIAEEDIPKTVFNTRYGHYEWLVMSFGLTNAPATFQSLMNDVFKDLINAGLVVYLHDILVYSSTETEHLQRLRQTFQRLRENQLYAQLPKCEFLSTRLEYLGHIIDGDGIRVDPAKVQAIREWPQPATVKELQSFLGIANCYRKFIAGFARIATPLTNLLQQQVPWQWGTQQEEAFQQLKTALSSAPVLAYPDFAKQFIVTTDASDTAVGAVLQQEGIHGRQPVAFFSRKLKGAELNWTTSEKKAIAQVLAIKEWRCFSEGAHFLLKTDHHPLVYLQTQATLSRKQARWLEFLQQYSFSVQHVQGKS